MSSLTRAAAPSRDPILIKSLTRRPTLVRKRDDADTNLDDATILSSPTKRAKVAFDSEVEVRVMGDWEKAPELIREEVRRAVERHAVGDDSTYDRVKEIYSTRAKDTDAPTSTIIRKYTSALLSSVSMLNRSCAGLVHTVLKSEWLGRDEAFVALHVRFLGNLVSAQGIFLNDVLRMLLDNMTSVPPSSGRLPNELPVSRTQIHNRAHSATKYLLHLIPSASSILSSVISKTFPHSSDSQRAHIIYVKNLLKLIVYAPELRLEVLALITERLVKIDVQVQVDLEDLAEDVGDGLVQGIPQLRSDFSEDIDDADEDSDHESDTSDESLDPDGQRAKDITNNVEKLDLILDVLFSYYNPFFLGASISVREAALDVLLSQFATIILPTFRSRHTQFLLFHFAQTSPALIDNFVGACVHIAFDKGRSAIIRQSAAAYLASFVARGIHVPSQIVRDVFDYIGSSLDDLRSDYELACRGPDLRRYSSYYSLVQALLYIFCFRWRDLEAGPEEDVDEEDLPAVDEQEHTWIPGVKETLAQNVFSRLNPLKVCSPAIVTEFARITNHLGIIYVFHLLETNKRLRLSQFGGSYRDGSAYNQPERETALSARKDESYQQLDEYFPFDPYHLPRSKRWIEGDYKEWKGIPGLDDDKVVESESESESEDDDDDESDVEEGVGSDELSSSS